MTTNSTQSGNNGYEFAIHLIYLKDLSYEAPHTPTVFQEEWGPTVDMDINIENNSLKDSFFEIVLRITLTVKKADKVMFISEVKQAGVFSLKGVSESDHQRFVMGQCPSILFPYAREALSSLAVKGGFPPVNLAPINFDALYLQNQKQPQPESLIVPPGVIKH